MMTDHFITRLVAKTRTITGDGSSISIRPAITPDILPETFYLPEQRIPSQRDVFDIIHIKDVKPGKSDISHLKESTTDNTTTKTEKGFVDIPASTEAKDVIEPTESKKSVERAKEPAMTSVSKDIDITDSKPQENSEERKSEVLRVPPGTVVVKPRESAETRHENLSAASPKSYDFLQTGKNNEVLHSEPEVTINIGRIDVRAAVLSDKPAPKTQQFPPLSLREYLKQRSEGTL